MKYEFPQCYNIKQNTLLINGIMMKTTLFMIWKQTRRVS